MHDEDTVSELRAQVRRAQDRFESLVRLDEKYPDVEWILGGIDRADAELFKAKQALQAALEPPPPPPSVSAPAPPPSAPPVVEPVDPSSLTWKKQARFHDCAQFRTELGQALARIVADPDGVFTRESIAREIGKCSADTLDNRCRDCQVDLSAEIARAQRSRTNSEPAENFG